MSLLDDVRIALRSLRSHRTYAVISLLTIALVVGAGSAVLAVVSATFIRPLPFADASRLVWVYAQPPGTADVALANPLHSTEFVRFRERLRQLDVAGIWARERALGVNGEAETVSAGSVSANYFDVLGLAPSTGRMFTDAEDRADARVAVISDAFWHARLGGRPALTEALTIDGERYAVIGVMPPVTPVGFVSSDVYTPLHMDGGNMPLQTATLVLAAARLKPGVSLDQAVAEIAPVMRDVVQELPASYTGWSASAIPMRDALFGQTRPALLLLLCAVVLLTTIACANLANVTIAEVMGRRDEITLRAALGASRGSIVRLLAVENVLVALTGGAVGLIAARAILPAILELDANTAAQLGEVAIDWRVEAGALGLTLVVSLVSGVLPALVGTAGDLARGLAQGGRRTAGSPRQIRTRAWLVGVETLVASVLLTGSALLLSAFNHAAASSPGFDPRQVLSTQVRLPAAQYPTPESRTAFVVSMLDAVRRLPGVVDVGITNPLSAGGGFQTSLTIEDHPSPDGQPRTVQFRRVGPGYFRTMRIPELRGRTFVDSDNPNGQQVAIVSQNFASRFWPGEDAIGRRVTRLNDPTHPLTVVGIVGDASDAGLAVPAAPTIYVAYAQNNSSAAPLSLVARTAGDPHDLIRAVTQAIHRVDPALPLSRTRTLEEFLSVSLGADRFRSVLLVVFAALGLALAAIGIYGVTSRGVTERTRELGVRLALGSGRVQLWQLVLRQALAAVAIGLGISVPAAIVLLRLLSHWLPGMTEAQPLSALPAVIVLAVVGALAAAVPAFRAARLDPLVALRAD